MFSISNFLSLLALIGCLYSRPVSAWLGVPTVPFVESTKSGSYSLQELEAIIVDSKYEDTVDLNGQTLIPPTLKSFAQTFSDDLNSTLGIQVPVKPGNSSQANSVFLTLGNVSDYLDVAGRKTSEGYTLEVTISGITVKGASPLGVFWASRTILQQAVLNASQIAFGSAIDSPGWGTRGVMLDVGRHYYPPEFILEMCSYLSFFKQNVFHLHLSDNLYNNVDIYTTERSLELYAAFRPNSDDPAVAGLSKRSNESYYREDFEMMQQGCAARGVTIIPELEAPGHALVITQWKPELGLSTDLSLLNISYSDTIPTMQTIWKTFLPWFHSKIVHIGADEYSSDLVADYTSFVNAMHSFITSISTKEMRIWGTFAPTTNETNVNTNVSIQHWEFFEANPYWDFIKNGYQVLNSDDAFYIVNKWSGSYPQVLNLTRVFFGNPDGGPMAPNIFDTSNSTNNPARDDPNVLGQVAALWNDYGPNATSYIEAYYALRDGLPALADKQWGGTLLLPEYTSIITPLIASIPGQNLDRKIPSKSNTSTILSYTFSTGSKILDSSGNDYHGINHGCQISSSTLLLRSNCSITTPLTSKGRNYTLSFSVKPTSSTPGPLFSGPESSLLAGNGSISNVTLVTGGNAYSLNYSLPLNTWSDVSLVGKGNATFLDVKTGNGTSRMEFLTKVGVNGDEFVWGPMSILAPLERIGGGGFVGGIKEVVLSDGA